MKIEKISYEDFKELCKTKPYNEFHAKKEDCKLCEGRASTIFFSGISGVKGIRGEYTALDLLKSSVKVLKCDTCGCQTEEMTNEEISDIYFNTVKSLKIEFEMDLSPFIAICSDNYDDQGDQP